MIMYHERYIWTGKEWLTLPAFAPHECGWKTVKDFQQHVRHRPNIRLIEHGYESTAGDIGTGVFHRVCLFNH